MRQVIDLNTYFGVYPRRNVDYSPEALRRLMEENGVSKAVTVSLKGVLYDHVEGNAETLSECAGDGGLVPAATIDPRKYTGQNAEVEQLKERGFKLVRLFPEFQGWPMSYSPVRSIAKAMQDVNLPLMVNTTAYGSATDLVRMTEGCTFPIILSGVGYWTLSEAVVLMKEKENIFLESSHLDSPDAIETIVGQVGVDRILFGSNAPVTYFRGPYLTVTNSDVSDKDKEMILHWNALRILGSV